MSRASHDLTAQGAQDLLGDKIVRALAQLVHHHRQCRRIVRGQGAQPFLESSHAQRWSTVMRASARLLEGLAEKQIRLHDPAQHDARLTAKRCGPETLTRV